MNMPKRFALTALSAILCLSLSGCIGSLLYSLAGEESSSEEESSAPATSETEPETSVQTEPGAETEPETDAVSENPEDLLDYGDIQDVKDGPLELWMENSYDEGAPVYVKVNGVSPELVEAGASVALYRMGDAYDEPIEALPLAEGEAVYRLGAQTPGKYDVRLYGEGEPFRFESHVFTLPFAVPGSFDDGAGNSWAALYAEYLRGVDFAVEELYFVDGYATMPSCVMNGVYAAVSDISFYEIPGYDYPLMAFTEFFELEEGTGRLDGTPGTLVFLIKDGAVTYDKTEAERAAILAESPAGGSFVNGEPLMHLGLFDTRLGSVGEAAVNANFAAVYDWLGTQPAPAALPASIPDGLTGFWRAEFPNPNGQGRVLIEAAFNASGEFYFAAGWLESEFANHVVGTYTVSGNEITAAGTDTFSGEAFHETFTYALSGDTLLFGYKGGPQQALERTEPGYDPLPIELE